MEPKNGKHENFPNKNEFKIFLLDKLLKLIITIISIYNLKKYFKIKR